MKTGSLCLLGLLFAGFGFAQDLPLKDLLIDGEGWQLVGEGYKFTEGPAVNDQGDVFFVDVPTSKIYRINVREGYKVTEFVSDSFKASGAMFGADGRLYATCGGKRAILAFNAQGQAQPCIDDASDFFLCLRQGRFPAKQS